MNVPRDGLFPTALSRYYEGRENTRSSRVIRNAEASLSKTWVVDPICLSRRRGYRHAVICPSLGTITASWGRNGRRESSIDVRKVLFKGKKFGSFRQIGGWVFLMRRICINDAFGTLVIIGFCFPVDSAYSDAESHTTVGDWWMQSLQMVCSTWVTCVSWKS